MEFLGWSFVLSGISKGYSKKAQNSREVHTFQKSMSSTPFPSPICFSSGIAQYCQRFSSTGLLSEQRFPSLSMSYSSAVIHYFVLFHKVSRNSSSVPAEALLWLLIPFRVTFSHFIFGLQQRFFCQWVLPKILITFLSELQLRATYLVAVTRGGHSQIWQLILCYHFT